MGSSSVGSQAAVRGTWALSEQVKLNINMGSCKAQCRDQTLFRLSFICQESLNIYIYINIYIPEPAVAAGLVCLSCMSVLGLPRPFSAEFFLWLSCFISPRWEEDKRDWRRMDHQPATSFLQLSYKCKLWVWVQGSPLKTGRCWIPKLHICCWSAFSKPTVVC